MCTLLASSAAFARVPHILLKVPANKPFTVTLPGHPITPNTMDNFWVVAHESQAWCGTAHYSTENRKVLAPSLDQMGMTGEEQFTFLAPAPGEKMNLRFKARGNTSLNEARLYTVEAE